MKLLTAGVLTVAVLCFASNVNAQNGAQTADLVRKRLPPSAFKQLPANIVRSLQRRGCTIPQYVPNFVPKGSPEYTHYNKPHNVIKGAFAKPGQTDWAVLCSRHGISSILVFWHGSTNAVAEIAARPDDPDRNIDVVGRAFIVEHYNAYGGPKPPPIDHNGINDGEDEKGSGVLYYYGGKWLELAGAD